MTPDEDSIADESLMKDKAEILFKLTHYPSSVIFDKVPLTIIENRGCLLHLSSSQREAHALQQGCEPGLCVQAV
jgi:hypothetical protein